MKIFGFDLNKKEVKEEALPQSPLPPTDVDKGAVTAKQSFGFDFDYTFDNDSQQIKEYRRIASNAEAQEAIEEIVNDCIVFSKDGSPVEVTYNDTIEKISTNIKSKINDEFSYIMSILKFNDVGDDLFKDWYVVGKQSYHLVLDEKKSTIADIRMFDPLTLSKKTEIHKEKDKNGIEVVKSIDTYFEYMENPDDKHAKEKIRFSEESIVHITSGMKDENGKRTVSHLHSAIRPFNQLVMLEDSMVVFYVSRAPERRVYYIDVGQLPKTKADEYMRSVVAEQKNNIVYDSATGTVKDNKHIMSVMEDIFIPRREGSSATSIESLSNNADWNMEGVEYLRRKMYKALKVPMGRLEQDSSIGFGRQSEITRDELKFDKFKRKLQTRFSGLFRKSLMTQLVLKKIITPDEVTKYSNIINFSFNVDMHFEEQKRLENLNSKLEVLRDATDYEGKYYSRSYVRKHLLQQSDVEIEALDKEMEDEKKKGLYDDQ